MIDNQLLSQAQNGDAEVQYLVGLYYGSEENGELNYAEAVRWYLKAAEANHAKAQNDLANILIDGKDDVPQDIEQAISWYTKAANYGNAGAQFNLAMKYYLGKLIEKDYEKAIFWFEKAAQQGDADAYERLGYCYDMGRGVSENPEKAAEMWSIAADMEHPSSTDMLGSMYLQGRGVEEDEIKAASLFEKAALLGDAGGMYNIGRCCQYGWGTEKNIEQAVEWYRQSAEKGNCFGYYRLGLCYRDGNGVAKDGEKAFYNFEKAAEEDLDDAQLELAKCYERGFGVPENYEKAFCFYQKAAEQDNGLAQYMLGVYYMDGIGRSQDYEAAFCWYSKSAENGCELPYYYLGQMYQKGIGTSVDYDKAIQHYMEVSEDKQSEAFYLIASIYSSHEKNDEAYDWYCKAAEMDNVDAMLELAKIHNNARTAEDIRISTKWAEKAAEKGHPTGMILAYFGNSMMGHAMVAVGGAKSPGTAEVLEKAKHYLEQAIQNGYDPVEARKSSDSLYKDLGDCYFVTDRTGEAFECYKKTEDPIAVIHQGIMLISNDITLTSDEKSYVFNRLAHTIPNSDIEKEKNGWGYFILGIMKQHGIGIQQDTNEAYNCFSWAQDMGFNDASNELAKYKKKLFGGYEYVG